MKKVLVTVGTTPFDSLFQAFDACQLPLDWLVECQIASGEYVPTNHPWFRFDDSFKNKLLEADIIISHAGAGTVFQLLELGKKCIVIANLERKDKHQRELSQYVERRHYGLGVQDLTLLQDRINKISEFVPSTYHTTSFFMGNELTEKIRAFYQ